ncbi:hemerythrin-like metal-binding domain protein [Candidatus Electrothrix marina]|uniref:Hemerythrin-like metal-binding domain protein n=1 Tax=Candidatus Electrothrix marina TaxID=1859130 RepID=A0A3S3QJ33_9BACT|nr:hemerythrin-like metal-binding domain protein [Candidatus Electrothrix marina]RWX51075.1 hemerythrin-like metal-binding domain protein [Candidatus Electrothrix marina]
MQKNFNWLDEYGTQLAEVDQHHRRFSRIIEELSAADDRAIIRRLNGEINFDWNEIYSTGVKEIDAQHKHFLEIIKNIAEINNGAFTCSMTAGLLDDVLDYTVLHFQTEERLMKHYGYPKFSSHRKEHEVLLTELQRQVRVLKALQGPSAKMLYFLMQWFIQHTLYTDQDIGRYIQEQRRSFFQRWKLRYSRLRAFGLLKSRAAGYDCLEKKVKVSRGVAKKYSEYS